MEVSKKLIKACINQKHKAQKELYEISYGYLMKICFRYAKTEDEAIELMNIGFCKILLGLKKKPINSPYKYWARTTMINSIIDEFRKSKSYYENIILSEQNDFNVTDLESVINEAVNKLNVDDLYKLIKQLPNITQKVFNLYVIDGYTHEEIGEKLKMSDGTSKWHLSTAKKILKEKISVKQESLALNKNERR